MHLKRAEKDLMGHDVEYWVNHFLSCDDAAREDVMKLATMGCKTWDEALSIVEGMPWCVHPELCNEGDIPWRINNFFSSGDTEAADVLLDAAWGAYDAGYTWNEIISAATLAEQQWRKENALQKTRIH